MKDTLVAVLDVGSNSVRLLVAKRCGGRIFCLHTQKITTRLIAGMENGLLAPQALERTAQAIFSLAREAREMGAEQIAAFGTSALRDGLNRDLLVGRCAQEGISLRVLSGDEEADLAYAGAAPQGNCGVIDIGGGSTEMLAGENGLVQAALSVPMGAVRLFERVGPQAQPGQMIDEAMGALAPAWEKVKHCAPRKWVGVGGTITSLAAMCLKLAVYSPDRVQDYSLSAAQASYWLHHLVSLPMESRQRIPGLNPQRADIMPCGAALVCAFFRLTGAEYLLVSDRDNLIGFIQKYLPEGVDNPS